jgi:RNA polymerase sigma-70 factor (ECF subfamily)
MPEKNTNESETPLARFEARALPHLDLLYNRALDLTGSREVAAGLVKESFVRAWRAAINNGPAVPTRAQLFAIMFALLAQERPAGTRRTAGDAAVLLGAGDTGDGTGEAGGDGEEASIMGFEWGAEHVAAVLDWLPDEFRDPLVLVDADGFTHEDAAQVCRCSVSALRARLFRARRALCTRLGASVRMADRAGGTGFSR